VVFNGILKLMPSLARTINYRQLTSNRSSKGFTLIELLIVIVLFGITSTLITASYLTFEKNQRIKNAAQTLKNDLRFAQNKALAGDKGANSECPQASTLVGWYVKFDTTQTSTYTYAGVCNTGGVNSPFNPKTVTFPSGVTLYNSIDIGGIAYSGNVVKVLFKPLSTGISLHDDSNPPFNSASVILQTGNLVVKLKDQQSASPKYQITIQTSGEISETKI